MENDLTKKAQELLAGEEGRRIQGKRAELERLAASQDGQRVKAMLERGGFEDAVKRGDAAALKNAMGAVMQTDSGRQLIDRLRELMGQK